MPRKGEVAQRRKARSVAAAPADAREREIIEGLKPACICKGIRTRTIVQLIRAGKRSIGEIRRLTGAGSGSCKGERCTERITALLREYGGKASGGR